MGDRLLFTASRFLWPIHNLLLLFAIGFTFGEEVVAEYTYALALAAPLYFLTTYSFPMFLVISGSRYAYRGELAWLRIASAVATVPLVGAAGLLLPLSQAHIFVALWVVKVGEILFDPVPGYIATQETGPHRGRRLFLLDSIRALVAQALVWYCILVLKKGVVVLLLIVGGVNMAVGMWFLLTVPQWTRPRLTLYRARVSLRRLRKRATPMTLSGALLALLVSLPRLLSEPFLQGFEKAIFGVAQVIGSAIALSFNALWLYEMHRIRSALARLDLARARAIMFILSSVFAVMLASAGVLLAVGQAPILAVLKIAAPVSALFPTLVLILGLQHCISIHRDALKLVGKQWVEVGILFISLVAATLTHAFVLHAVNGSWLESVAAMCIVTALIQVLSAHFTLQRLRPAGTSPT